LTGLTGLRIKSEWHDLGGSSGDEQDRIYLVEEKKISKLNPVNPVKPVENLSFAA
jgi:hypothetical protein